MQAFLLPCRCGADISVSSSQAGGRATCPVCGGVEPVPRLRDLEKLRVVKTPPPSRRDSGAGRPWTGMHSLVLAGTLLAATAGLGSFSFTPPEAELFDEDTIRSSVMKAPIDEVYTAWATRLIYSSVERMPTELEAKSRARSDYYHNLRNSLRAAAGMGALVALTGVVGVLARGKANGR